jgi:hypothetical protein
MDAKTTKIASELVAMYDAAVNAENLAEMERIVGIVTSCPNRPLKREVMRLLDL